jgi:hypothetical protein
MVLGASLFLYLRNLPYLSTWFFNKYDELFKVTGHHFWRFVENRYCALKISPIFIKFSPNVRAKYDKVVKLTNNKIIM